MQLMPWPLTPHLVKASRSRCSQQKLQVWLQVPLLQPGRRNASQECHQKIPKTYYTIVGHVIKIKSQKCHEQKSSKFTLRKFEFCWDHLPCPQFVSHDPKIISCFHKDFLSVQPSKKQRNTIGSLVFTLHTCIVFVCSDNRLPSLFTSLWKGARGTKFQMFLRFSPNTSDQKHPKNSREGILSWDPLSTNSYCALQSLYFISIVWVCQVLFRA